MSAADPPRVTPGWLSLREEADATARASDLLTPLRRDLTRRHLTTGAARLPGRLVICDLGCGTGSMARWLAGRLPGPQHWILYDRDPELLDHAAAQAVGLTADGAPVTVQTGQRDITALTADDLAGVSLVTASALLDMLTREEVDRLAAACVGAGCPALLTLSVVGQVELLPADPLDEEIGAAFNAHQRRRAGDRRLLGPDAPDAAAEAFTRYGAAVLVRPSPWRLGADQSALTGEWLRGWVGAACEQRPALAAPAAGYLGRRLAAAAAGELAVVVGHRDLLGHLR
jgi:SAM-dependent methyltransferase